MSDQWNLELIYPSLSDWETDFKTAEKDILSYESLKGTFHTKEGLLQYAKMRSQISSIENYLLDTPTQKTKNSLTVQSYLLQKINILKLNKNLPQCIMYDAIYDLFDEFKNNELPLKTKESMRSRIRKAITDILNFWVQEKFIENYEIERKDKAYYKINIKI